MKKSIILCNTYYQLIFAIQMRLTILHNDSVDIIITDQSLNAASVVKRLEKESLFNRCFYVETKKMTLSRNKLRNVYAVFEGTVGASIFNEIVDIYDRVFIHNFDIASYALFASLYRNNKKIEVNRYEEGIISYRNIEAPSKKKNLVKVLRKAFRWNILEEQCENFYCFFPDFYQGDYRSIRIEPIDSTGEISSILKRVFDVHITENDYKEKYIYFTSVYDFEGGSPIHEYDLVSKISKLVGKDNLIIKMHPRDSRGLYEKGGFTIDQHSTIPWEVIQLCMDFSDKVLLSTNSTSIVSTNLMTSKGAEAYYTYKLCDINGNAAAIKTTGIINELLSDEIMSKKLSRVHIANNIMELLQNNE